MKHRLCIKRCIAWIVCCMIAATTPLFAISNRTIHIANDQAFTDHIALKSDLRDMDIMVKFMFDEPNNTLIVSLLSYRNLLMLDTDMRYNQVISWNKFRPQRLPYVIQSDVKTTYKVTSNFKKEIPGCRSKHVIRKGITYKGLQLQAAEGKMMNDYLEYRFDILNKDTLVSISLGDIMVLEPSVKHKDRVDMVFYSALNRSYDIYIDRNACLGRDEDIAAAQAALQSIEQSYQSLKSSFDAGCVAGVTDTMLYAMKKVVVDQFARRGTTDACPTLLQLNTQYNQYVDSLAQLHLPDPSLVAMPLNMSKEYILQLSRTIDENVSNWLLTTDAIKKRDIVTTTQNIVAEVNDALRGNVIISAEQRDAIAIFRKAERYFKNICK